MTRIIAGRSRGRRLKAPVGTQTRPTGARVRQALFDILAPRLTGCRFLDAFAGGGAVGLEALSRGAARVVLVEQSAPAVAVLRANTRALDGAPGAVVVLRQDARVALPALLVRGERFDLVFLDPPYEGRLYEETLPGAARLLDEDGLLIAQHFHKRALPETMDRLQRTRLVRIGDHCLSFYRPVDPGRAAGEE
jgi:16S rRNA (guanine(966)-N(2))-methyltransferase RsmD